MYIFFKIIPKHTKVSHLKNLGIMSDISVSNKRIMLSLNFAAPLSPIRYKKCRYKTFAFALYIM